MVRDAAVPNELFLEDLWLPTVLDIGLLLLPDVAFLSTFRALTIYSYPLVLAILLIRLPCT